MKIRPFLLAGLVALSLACSSCEKRPVAHDPPNILVCIADDASWPHMSAYGTSWIKTPAFDKVATEGILFTRAYTPNAKCAPSRACLLTGRNSWQLEEAANHWCYFPRKFKTYVEALGENGYFTGHTAKGWAPGIALTADGMKRELTGKAYNDAKTDPPTTGVSKIDYASNFEKFLQDKPEGKPFCFWYGGYEPHRRYEYGSGINKGNKQLSDIDQVFDFWPDNDTVRTDMLDYAFELEYFDRHLMRMLQTLEEEGLLDNTIIVVTADNGMPFPRIKGQEYEYSNHIPMAIMWKNGIRSPGRVVDDFVSFIDLAPTFLELAGISENRSGMAAIQGKSLTDIFYTEKEGIISESRDHVLIGKERHDVGRPYDVGYPIRGIVKGDFLYIRNFETDRWPAGDPVTGYLNCDGSPTKTVILNLHRQDMADMFWPLSFGKRVKDELYYIKDDPECMRNLAFHDDHRPLMESMKKQLFSELKKQGDPRMSGQGHIFDEYPYADKRSAHFYERYMSGEKLNASWVNPMDFEKH